MRQRTTFNEKSSEEVKQAFKNTFSYNPETGEITHIKKDREYDKTQKKGYKESIYLTVDKIEYRATYHRLCWFLYYNEVVTDNLKIDHEDNIKSNNRIKNLRICNNTDNSLKRGFYKSNTSGYKGVSYIKDNNGFKDYYYYISVVKINKKGIKIGRFKCSKIAACFYDAAVKYYHPNFNNPNFTEDYIIPSSIENLRILKNDKLFIKNLKNKLDEQMVTD